MHLRTPLLVNVWQRPEEYLAGLNKPARKNWAATQKRAVGVEFGWVPYDPGLMRRGMEIWAAQGFRWVMGPEYFDGLAGSGNLVLFGAGRDGKFLALHPVEWFEELMYCQPVLYSKGRDPWVARFMWFSLMLWACREPRVEWVDLGGGFHGSWREFLRNRSDPAFRYKWQYVSKKVKENPDDEKAWWVQRCDCGWKKLVEGVCRCPGCGRSGASGRRDAVGRGADSPVRAQ